MADDNVGEGGQDVERIQPDAEGKIPPEKDGKYPEVVSWSKYVGIKEKFNRVETDLKGKVTNLEEQLKTTVSAEEHKKVQDELDKTKGELQTTSETLKTQQEKTLMEKRADLKNRGLSEDEVKAMSEKELDAVSLALAKIKPRADMGSGGGGSGAPSTGMGKIRQGFDTLHPSS